MREIDDRVSDVVHGMEHVIAKQLENVAATHGERNVTLRRYSNIPVSSL